MKLISRRLNLDDPVIAIYKVSNDEVFYEINCKGTTVIDGAFIDDSSIYTSAPKKVTILAHYVDINNLALVIINEIGTQYSPYPAIKGFQEMEIYTDAPVLTPITVYILDKLLDGSTSKLLDVTKGIRLRYLMNDMGDRVWGII